MAKSDPEPSDSTPDLNLTEYTLHVVLDERRADEVLDAISEVDGVEGMSARPSGGHRITPAAKNAIDVCLSLTPEEQDAVSAELSNSSWGTSENPTRRAAELLRRVTALEVSVRALARRLPTRRVAAPSSGEDQCPGCRDHAVYLGRDELGPAWQAQGWPSEDFDGDQPVDFCPFCGFPLHEATDDERAPQ